MPVAFDRAAHLRRIGYKKGQSGNAGRSKKDNRDLVDIKRLAKVHTRDGLAALVEIMNDPKQKAADRIAAAREVFDRGWNRPAQSIDIEATLQKKWGEMTLEDIAHIRRLKAATVPMMIEAVAEASGLVEAIEEPVE
jgi:hypothetical protein